VAWRSVADAVRLAVDPSRDSMQRASSPTTCSATQQVSNYAPGFFPKKKSQLHKIPPFHHHHHFTYNFISPTYVAAQHK